MSRVVDAEFSVPISFSPVDQIIDIAVVIDTSNSMKDTTRPGGPRKIDAAVTTVLAHEAAADARATGWSTEPTETYFRLPR